VFGSRVIEGAAGARASGGATVSRGKTVNAAGGWRRLEQASAFPTCQDSLVGPHWSDARYSLLRCSIHLPVSRSGLLSIELSPC